jgi:mono/diheme cytochrome c family protein
MAHERPPQEIREGVRDGILASIKGDVELRGGRTARLLVAAGVVGVAGAVGVTLVISGHSFGHHPPYVALSVPSPTVSVVGPAQGRTLVQQRGCIGCHVVEGQGGTMGPRLDGVSARRSEAFVIQQLRDPKANNPATLMPNLGLAPAELEAIWAYLQTLDGTDGN